MIVSWNWLSQYVPLDMPVEELTDRLALSGLNHESTTEVGGDLAIDLEVTSNRADCLSHLGVAREIAVLYGKPAPALDPRPVERGDRVESTTSVVVEAPDLCPLFTARVVSGVKVGESPWWMKRRLETVGIRPISNVVDITNYVMFECGQPLHAYDLDALGQKRLVVRNAVAGESLRAINGKTYELTPSMLVIADGVRPVGLAGVMGGLETEIGASTRTVLIEAAQFDPVCVRRTSRALGLFSPSSYRFERGLDPERTEWANRRCAELMVELAGGSLHPGTIVVGNPTELRPVVTLRFAQIARVLGIEVPPREATAILQALGLELLELEGDFARVRPPSWRPDLTREIDLIEEIARIHGYHHIPEDRSVPLARSARAPRERLEAAVRGALTGLGFDEAYTFSLVAEPLDAPLAEEPARPSLRVDHSSRKKENAMRQSLVPSLLAARAYNEAHGVPDAALFEIASVYRPSATSGLPDESVRLGLVSGLDFAGVKGVVEALLDQLHVGTPLSARRAAPAMLAPGRAAELRLGAAHLGYLGEVCDEIRAQLGLRGPCSAVELRLQLLIDESNLVSQYTPLPPFPPVNRDLSLVVDRACAWCEIESVARAAAGDLLEQITYLDTFLGGNLPADRQSIHFGLRFRHPERTLTSEEVDRAIEEVVLACGNRLGAALRA
jgi:phenylalanyl-tRNA synthetase beta chain